MRVLIILSIKGYQRYLSPYKGFKCAHARLYGGESCSSAIMSYVRTSPLRQLPLDIRNRAQECKRASVLINDKNRRKRREGNESEVDCCFWGTWGMCWPE